MTIELDYMPLMLDLYKLQKRKCASCRYEGLLVGMWLRWESEPAGEPSIDNTLLTCYHCKDKYAEVEEEIRQKDTD
jgi:hypothetical protein